MYAEDAVTVIIERAVTRRSGGIDVESSEVRRFVKPGADFDETIVALREAGFIESHGDGLVTT